MGRAIAITRLEHMPASLRVLAAKNRDGEQVRRLLAIAFVLEGRSRGEAAQLVLGLQEDDPGNIL
jgi:putative transposase